MHRCKCLLCVALKSLLVVGSPTAATFITIDEAADMLSVRKSWVYARQDSLPWVVRVSPRRLRCDVQKLREWTEAGGVSYAASACRKRK